MPGRDQTGPMGEGPLTGRWWGTCSGFGRPGFPRSGNFWRGFGGGRGRWRNGPFANRFADEGWFEQRPLTSQEELEVLMDESEWLKSQLDAIQKRISELERKDSE